MTANQELAPLPYQSEIKDYLKTHERALWDWFSSARSQQNYAEALRTDLLKSTYRFDPQSHAELYASVETIKARLNLDIPVTLYQARDAPQPNATLYFLPGEGHIVFSGPLLTLLNSAEVQAIVAHELAHYVLWSRDNGEFHIAARLLDAVADDPRSAPSHEQTAIRYQLYTELFADRGSLHVAADLHSVVAGLVKIQTGIAQINPADYLKQAEEIFTRGAVSSDGLSHPEGFIRARALALWHAEGAASAAAIRAMIEGPVVFDRLDLLDQVQLSAMTRRILQQLLRHRWFQTPAVLGHAKLYFADFQPASPQDPGAWDEERSSDAKWRDYLCYVLLDFVAMDPQLEELPLAAAFEMARRLKIEAAFEKIAGKELKIKQSDLRRVKENTATLLAQAEVQHE